MSCHEEGSDSERIEMETTPLQQHGGSTREEGLNEVDHHLEEGLTNDNTSASKQEEVEVRGRPKDFKKRECNTFIEDSSSDERCQCGRPRDKHPTDIKTAEDTVWTAELHSSEQPTDAFGYLEVEGNSDWCSHFQRLSSDTEPSLVYDLMTRSRDQDGGWGLDQPILVVSVVGGEGSAEVKPWIQEVIRKGLVDKTGGQTWILTEGFDEGVGRCVGEAARDLFPNVRAVGVTPWGFVHNRHQLVNPQGFYYPNPARYSVENKTSDSGCLDKNQDDFLLVDDGSEGRGGGEKNCRVKLEEHLSTKHIRESSSITIPFLYMLISGEPSMLEWVDVSLKNAKPWLVLAGSGGVADFLSDILENPSPASAGVDVDRVTELVKKHFSSEAQTDQLVEQVQSIYQNRKLITFYHEKQERPEYFDTVMIKALMPASKHAKDLKEKKEEDTDQATEEVAKEEDDKENAGDSFPYGGELILAMSGNRLDFATSELFKGDIKVNQMDEALKDCMAFALANNKLEFVRLFIEKFNMHEYLTYGLLEKLYSRVDKGTLVYGLLLECLEKRLGTSPDSSDFHKEISLFEVSGVLKKLMGEEKPFYFPVLGLKDTFGKKALERVKLLLQKEPPYRNKLCESPWTDLFIWAVLQNYGDMAFCFWEKAEESVMNALGASKMLREMSKIEDETKNKHSFTELSQKFEDRAHGVLGSCCQSDERKSFKLLNTESPVWGTNCFQMAIDAESLLFFNHDGLEVWWGDMMTAVIRNEAEKPVWMQLLVFPFYLLFPCYGPASVFISNVLWYIVFLFLFAYMLLVDFKPPPPSGPSSWECVLYFWVFTFLCEEVRQIFSVGYGYMTFCQRMRFYWQDFWNRSDLIAIILFIIGLICRMFERSYEFGRGVLCIDYMVFTLRLIHISAIHKEMGPKIIIVGKMMKDVAFFLFFLVVWLTAYGVANQALLFPNDSNPSRIFRRVFYIPYLSIFGEFDLQGTDVGEQWNMSCSTNATQIDGGAEPCMNVNNNWLVIILLVVFLLVTNILLINLLIAILSFTASIKIVKLSSRLGSFIYEDCLARCIATYEYVCNTFNKVEEKSDIYWRFQHYNLVMEYESRPVLAPPFIILSHLRYLFCSLMCRLWCKEEDPCEDFDLGVMGEIKESYTAEEVKEWETEQKKKFLEAQSETERNSDSERIKQISDNVQKQLTKSRDIDQRIQQISDKVDREMQERNQQMSDKMDNVMKQLTETTDNIEQRQRALETKVEKALSQILDTLAKAPWAQPPS